MITRYYSSKLEKLIKPGRVLVVYGPRRVGKTTLVENYLSTFSGKVYKSTGENIQLRRVLESSDFSQIIPFFTGYDLVVIDEAQKIPNIGNGLKIIVDQVPGVKIIATGSSSFDLSNKIGEPLVGRQKVITLYPVSAGELNNNFGGAYVKEELENLLIYGSYPEVLTSKSFNEKVSVLKQIRDSFLFKDVLAVEKIKNSSKIHDLLQLIAYQTGSEVSLNELGGQLGMSKNTVARYLDILEKSFVLFNLRPYHLNQRKAISKKSKYYFYDLGVRNAVIGNFNPIAVRPDKGALWENFLAIERIKKQAYSNLYSNNYFWRTLDQKEIDWVEERGGKLFGYEFKWERKQKSKNKKAWLASNPKNSAFKNINVKNFEEFIM